MYHCATTGLRVGCGVGLIVGGAVVGLLVGPAVVGTYDSDTHILAGSAPGSTYGGAVPHVSGQLRTPRLLPQHMA